MSSPTVDSLAAALNTLTGRVNLLDGQNLIAPLQGYTTVTNAKISGLKTDISQSTLALETYINQYGALIQLLIDGVNVLLGLAGQPLIVVPPTTPPTV